MIHVYCLMWNIFIWVGTTFVVVEYHTEWYRWFWLLVPFILTTYPQGTLEADFLEGDDDVIDKPSSGNAPTGTA